MNITYLLERVNRNASDKTRTGMSVVVVQKRVVHGAALTTFAWLLWSSAANDKSPNNYYIIIYLCLYHSNLDQLHFTNPYEITPDIMGELEHITVYTTSSVTATASHPTINALQWTEDGQLLFLTKTAVYILVSIVFGNYSPTRHFDIMGALRLPILGSILQ